jgi:hypothetical protein
MSGAAVTVHVLLFALCCCFLDQKVDSFTPMISFETNGMSGNALLLPFASSTSVTPVGLLTSGIIRALPSHSFLQASKDGNENVQNDENSDNDDLSWMKNAMNLPVDPKDASPTNSPKSKPLQSGIAGFAVDPKLGFVCVLAPDDNDNDNSDQGNGNGNSNGNQFTYVTVSPTDAVSSPEALCLIQLSGGLDLGAAVFPPETLAKVVANELMLHQEDDEEDVDNDGDDEKDDVNVVEEINVEELRSKVTLLGVTALPNERYAPPPTPTFFEDEIIKVESTPERDTQIEQSSPKVLPAILNLPGLTMVTEEEVSQAMQIHADAKGQLSREAFSELLDTLRSGGNGSNGRNRLEDQRIKMRITVSIAGDDGQSSLRLVDVDHVPVFQGVALALRYKVKITVSDECFKVGNDVNEESLSVLERFPAFKPVQELVEDARVSIFKQKATDNDDKV